MVLLNTKAFELRCCTDPRHKYSVLYYAHVSGDVCFVEFKYPRTLSSKADFHRLRQACTRAQNCGSCWVWMDPECIDKRSSAALSEAFNNLSLIYAGYSVSLIYLENCTLDKCTEEDVQEPLANYTCTRDVWMPPYPTFPKISFFYDRAWNRLGTEESLARQLTSATSIDQSLLDSLPGLRKYYIDKRISWASELRTSRTMHCSFHLLDSLGMNSPITLEESWEAFIQPQVHSETGISAQEPFRLGSSEMCPLLESFCHHSTMPISSEDFHSLNAFESDTVSWENSGSEPIDSAGQLDRSRCSTTESQARSTGQIEALISHDLDVEKMNEQAGGVFYSTVFGEIDVLGSGLFDQGSANTVDVSLVAADISTHPSVNANRLFAEAVTFLIKSLVEKFCSQSSRNYTKRTIISTEKQGRKRPRLARSEVSKDVEQSHDPEDFGMFTGQHMEESPDVLACPFYIWDKKNYRTCLTRYHFRNIEDVREHLSIVHRRPNFCPVCGCTFSIIADRDSHIRGRTCHTQKTPTSIFEGLTVRHIQELAQLAVLPLSAESHWYEMWATVFPDAERPMSCHYSTAEELRICALRKFYSRHRYSIMEDYLESRGLQSNTFDCQGGHSAALYNTVLNGAIDKISEVKDGI